MEQLVTSEFKLGIIAGGQLGKMLALAASTWDVKTFVMDTDSHCPASSVSSHFVLGDSLNGDDVYNFGKMVDLITFEIEHVDIGALKRLKAEGKRIHPDPEVLEIIQDKGLQKEWYARHQIPTSPFSVFSNSSEIRKAIDAGLLKLPLVQKLCKGGYDGKGVQLIKTESDWASLLEGASVVEQLVEIESEISVIVARNLNGEVSCFPVVEMEFNESANLVERLICPASLEMSLQQKAKDLATQIITSLNFCGILAVEMFVDKQQRIWINEMAPRPHNSGHHTIESTLTSQYEQHLRAIFNFPLGSTLLKMPSVMINLLGDMNQEGEVKYEGLTESLAIEGVKIHLYGKKITKPFRKMGHVTILAPTIDEAKQKSEIVKQKLKVKAW